MPDRTRDLVKKRASTARRQQRWRERRKAKREVAAKLAREAHRQELARKRAEKGLPPIKTSTQRAAECRERQAQVVEAIRLDSWYSPGFTSYLEAKAYLSGAKPGVPEPAIENTLEVTRRDSARWQLHWNRFVVTQGITAARLQRAILWQILDVLYQQDLTHLKAAMEKAATRIDLAFEPWVTHPNEQYQERMRIYDMSQMMLREGGVCIGFKEPEPTDKEATCD